MFRPGSGSVPSGLGFPVALCQVAERRRDMDAERDRDISSISAGHPGPINRDGQYPASELEWRNIGFGVFAKTFRNMSRLVTTSLG